MRFFGLATCPQNDTHVELVLALSATAQYLSLIIHCRKVRGDRHHEVPAVEADRQGLMKLENFIQTMERQAHQDHCKGDADADCHDQGANGNDVDLASQ